MSKSTNKHLDNAYSFLFASVLTLLLVTQSISISISSDRSGDLKFSITSKDLQPYILYGYALAIGGTLGLPTDKIVILIAKLIVSAKINPKDLDNLDEME